LCIPESNLIPVFGLLQGLGILLNVKLAPSLIQECVTKTSGGMKAQLRAWME
jgi:hypothetical protein